MELLKEMKALTTPLYVVGEGLVEMFLFGEDRVTQLTLLTPDPKGLCDELGLRWMGGPVQRSGLVTIESCGSVTAKEIIQQQTFNLQAVLWDKVDFHCSSSFEECIKTGVLDFTGWFTPPTPAPRGQLSNSALGRQILLLIEKYGLALGPGIRGWLNDALQRRVDRVTRLSYPRMAALFRRHLDRPGSKRRRIPARA